MSTLPEKGQILALVMLPEGVLVKTKAPYGVKEAREHLQSLEPDVAAPLSVAIVEVRSVLSVAPILATLDALPDSDTEERQTIPSPVP